MRVKIYIISGIIKGDKMAPFSRNDTLPDEKSSLIENSIFSPEEESALINKPKLILLGENHMFSSGPALLKQISAEYNSLLFLEIHNKFHIHRLYNAHVNPDDPAENEKRKNILGNLTFNYPDTFCVDMDYQSKYYMNEGMRDHYIISNINKIFNAQNETPLHVVEHF